MKALQKCQEQVAHIHNAVYEARRAVARWFEWVHGQTIKNFDFKRGDLVLVWHTQIEKAFNQKMRPQYIGLHIVLFCNQREAYVLSELDGAVLDRPIAAF